MGFIYYVVIPVPMLLGTEKMHQKRKKPKIKVENLTLSMTQFFLGITVIKNISLKLAKMQFEKNPDFEK